MAPSSAHTSPSQMAMKAPSTQPSIACGPPMAMTTSGRVMNGPTPIMFIMLSDSALPKLTWRVSFTGGSFLADRGTSRWFEEFCMERAEGSGETASARAVYEVRL